MNGKSSGPVAGAPPRLQQVFDTLGAAGVRWSLLRPPEGLSQSVGDVDLLVEPGSLVRVRALIEGLGFVSVPMGGRDVHAIDFDPVVARFFWLHVQPEVRIAGTSVRAEEVLHSIVEDPLPRPTDAWLFWIVVLHGLLDKGSIAERHRPAVRRLAAHAGVGGVTPLHALAIQRGIPPERVVELAAAGQWHTLEALAAGASPERPALVHRVTGRWDRLRRLRTSRGVAVAVIGPDGAGKTTLVNGLRESLPFPVHVLYGGLTGGRLPRADALRLPGLVFAARMSLIWARYGTGAYHRLRGRIVLFDRYPLDAAVPSGAQLSPLARLSRRIQGRLCPRPDLVVVLDAPGTTMHERKGEYDPARLEQWRTAYRALGESLDRVAVVRADQPIGAVLADAQALIWQLYRERWTSRAAVGSRR